jgi:hypothetical protein
MMNDLEKRDKEWIHREFAQGTFVSCPGDVIYVKWVGGLSNTLCLHLVNEARDESVRFTAVNGMPAWEWLRKVHWIGGRIVYVESRVGENVLLHESAAYLSRFGKEEE